MTNEEFEYWKARSLLTPIGWAKYEFITARLISCISEGRVRFKDAFINPFEEIPEDDEDFINKAEELIKDKKQNGD